MLQYKFFVAEKNCLKHLTEQHYNTDKAKLKS